MDWLECLESMESLFRWKRDHFPPYPDLRLEWGLYHQLRGALAMSAGGAEAQAIFDEGAKTYDSLKQEGCVFDDFQAWDLWYGEQFPAGKTPSRAPGEVELREYFSEELGPEQRALAQTLIASVEPLGQLPEWLRRAAFCPSYARLFAAMAEFQARRNRKVDALCLYALSVLVGRHPARHWLHRAQWEQICGDPEQVEGYLTEGLLHFPDDIELLRMMAEEKDRQGDVATAITLLERAVDSKPDWPDLRYDLARLYERSEKLEESLVHFGKALELNPSYEKAALSHAEALMKLGDFAGAEVELLELEKRDLRSQRIFQMLSEIYAERGDRRRAEHFGVLGHEGGSERSKS